MKIKTPYFIINIEPLFLIVFFIFLMSIKIQKMLFYFYACYLFIIFHELSHMCIASLFGKDIQEFKVTMSGVCILLKKENDFFLFNNVSVRKKYIQNVLIYLCGPLSNLLLALLFYNNKMIFDINLLFCILNLIPIYPLDGYNVLKNLLLFINTEKVKLITEIVSKIFLFVLFLTGIFQIISIRNFSIIMFYIYLYMIEKQHIKNSRYDKIMHDLRC